LGNRYNLPGFYGYGLLPALSPAKDRSDEAAIALVVNPARLRSQDQLHVHIVRLEKDARQRLAGISISRLQDLDGVWRTAKKGAADANLDDYGVLVAGRPDGGFMIRVEKGSPEWLYTEVNCR
jgi:CDP-diacylglycerol pyrophosphatase